MNLARETANLPSISQLGTAAATAAALSEGSFEDQDMEAEKIVQDLEQQIQQLLHQLDDQTALRLVENLSAQEPVSVTAPLLEERKMMMMPANHPNGNSPIIIQPVIVAPVAFPAPNTPQPPPNPGQE